MEIILSQLKGFGFYYSFEITYVNYISKCNAVSSLEIIREFFFSTEGYGFYFLFKVNYIPKCSAVNSLEIIQESFSAEKLMKHIYLI